MALAAPLPLRGPLALRLGTRAHALAVGTLLFLASDPIYPLLMRGPSEWVSPVPGLDGMRRRVWLLIYLVMLGLFYAMRRHVPRALAGQHWLALALGWFLLSTLWSDDPMEGLVGGVQMAFVVVFGLVAGVRLGSEGIVQAVLWASMLCVGASLAFAAALPAHAFGFHYNQGALRGVYLEKNHLAVFLSYGVLAAGVWALAARSWLAWGYLGLITALTVMTVSSIALMQAALVYAGLGFFALARGVPTRGLIALMAGLCGLFALAIFLPVVLAALGEDLTLNGRTLLWAGLWEAVEARPLIGWGYRGYWSSEHADLLRFELGWGATGAHNAWLRALLWGGVVGLALWLVAWWGVIARAGRILARETDLARVSLAILVLMVLVWSLFETNQLAHFTHHAIVTGLVFALRAPSFR